MPKSLQAALLSGLVFPGAGHLLLKQYRRGWLLIIITLGALSVIVNSVVSQALAIVDRVNSGGIPYDTATIADMAAKSAETGGGMLANIALLIATACWLIGIIDAWRLGASQQAETG